MCSRMQYCGVVKGCSLGVLMCSRMQYCGVVKGLVMVCPPPQPELSWWLLLSESCGRWSGGVEWWWCGGGVVVWSGGVSKCQTDMLDKPGFHDSLRVAAHCPRNFYRLVAKHDSATFFICRATLLY